MPKVVVTASVVLVAAVLVLVVRNGRQPAIEKSEIDAESPSDGYQADLETIDPETWVRFYDPGDSSPGDNLVLYRRRLPMLVDMNGRLVHAWPQVRAVGRVRLDHEGRLAVIGLDNLVKEYDWDGQLLRWYQPESDGDFPHHDLIKLDNGNLLVPIREQRSRTDNLVEIGPSGEVVWTWSTLDHRDAFPTWDASSDDPTHINSVFELPPNHWYDEGDDRFRPGNILVSARDLNTVFVVDKRSDEVVWQYSEGLDHQHEAIMGRPDGPWDGLILLFDNGRDNVNAYRRSTIRAIDPMHGVEKWEYSSEYFFSSVGGTQQELPGGNLLITSSHGGRAFEITPSGDVVWEWTPPYLPMRIERLPYDFCPQLAGLAREPEIAVDRTHGTPFIDGELSAFALAEERIDRVVNGKERRVIAATAGCRELLIPPQAELIAEFGLDEERVGGRRVSARFTVSLAGDGISSVIVDATVKSSSAKLWKRRRVSLEDLAFRRLNMCLSVAVEGEDPGNAEVAVWGVPTIVSKTRQRRLKEVRQSSDAREEKLRRQRLEALGYVD